MCFIGRPTIKPRRAQITLEIGIAEFPLSLGQRDMIPPEATKRRLSEIRLADPGPPRKIPEAASPRHSATMMAEMHWCSLV
jgi:hypothetical protein